MYLLPRNCPPMSLPSVTSLLLISLFYLLTLDPSISQPRIVLMSLSGVSHSSLCSLFSSFWTDFALPSNWQWTLIFFVFLFYFSSVFLCCYTLQKHLVSWNSLPTWPWDSKSNIIYLQTMNNLLLDFFVSISLLCIDIWHFYLKLFFLLFYPRILFRIEESTCAGKLK